MIASKYSNTKILMAIFWPADAFVELSRNTIPPASVFFKYTLWLLILPPLFLWVGGNLFGWHIGADHPIELSSTGLMSASKSYFLALIFGFFSTVTISRWMAKTYGASTALGTHFALISIVGAPLAIVSFLHLFPHIVVNLMGILVALVWSMYLLYTGLPVVLRTSPEKGMLMASGLVGWLLVAAVSLLGITLLLWVFGFGPLLGV